MHPERAAELLKAHQVAHAETRRKVRVGALRGAAAKAAGRLARERWWTPYDAKLSGPLLEALPPHDREAAFAAIQPRLGRHLERMWVDGRRMPYQVGMARRAFRAPNDPAVTLPARHVRLVHVTDPLTDFEPDIAWVARWAAHLGGGVLGDRIGNLLAAAIDGGGPEADEVVDILVASAEGEDEIGAMGRHVGRALLSASREDGWTFIERLLLAAQRQEGLRQAILETVDEAQPTAFRRMLRTIVEHDLTRFPATVRAIDVWFGFQWASGSPRSLRDLLERTLRFLDEPAMGDGALRSGTPEDAYLALWALAFDDAPASIGPARALLGDGDAGRRFAAVHHLAGLDLQASVEPIADALDDEDVRVAVRAADAFIGGYRAVADVPADLFERFERLVERIPDKRTTLEPIVWPWTGRELDRQAIAVGLVWYHGKRPVDRLLGHLPRMDADGRAAVAHLLGRERRPSAEARRALLALAGDPAAQVRSAVIERVRRLDLGDDEAIELEAYLTRKAGDLRRAVVAMLLARGDAAALASADRLLAAGDGQQRLAGLEILRQLVESGRQAGPARARATAFAAAAGAKVGATERTQLAAILGTAGEPAPGDESEPTEPTPSAPGAPADADLPAIPRVADGFGLLDHRRRTLPLAPRRVDVAFSSPAAERILLGLDELVHAHRDVVVTTEAWYQTKEQPLGEIVSGFPAPPGTNPTRRVTLAPPVDPARVVTDLERSRERLPLHDTWVGWAAGRGPELRDGDRLELARTLFVPVERPTTPYRQPFEQSERDVDRILGAGRKPITLRHPHVAATVASWLLAFDPPAGLAAFLLDAAEALLAAIPSNLPVDSDTSDWRKPTFGWRTDGGPWTVTLRTAAAYRAIRPDRWSVEDQARLWRLQRWVDEGGRADLGPVPDREATEPDEPDRAPGLIGGLVRRVKQASATVAAATRPPRHPIGVEDVVAAFRAGAATEADLIDRLVGPGSGTDRWRGFDALGHLTARANRLALAEDPRILEIVDRARQRVVAVELRRGEAPTEASKAALALTWAGGLETLIPLVRALGSERFVRGWSYDGESRQVVFSRLIRATFPGPEDTPERIGAALKAARIAEKRLVELGCFAPQWADGVEVAVGWPGLASAIWWMHAHTKDPSWVVAQEIREAWTAEIAEQTPLDAPDLVDGAVDVAWFGRVYEQLGPARWKTLDAAAKYGSTGGGHKRAQLFADAMRGVATEDSIAATLEAKRHQDSARALGLVPLPEEPARDEAVLRRYRTLQEFVRTSRQFGSARQASEKRAAEIGLANLARTAGYADPIRLGWAMGARGVADLADGPLTATAGDVEVRLAIDGAGEPDLTFQRAGAPLKALPAEAKKSKEIAALRSRSTDLRRQASRMRRSLEQAMVRGDAFSGAELIDLLRHPLLAPQLRRLVLVGDGTVGYPIAEGRALLGADGREQAVGASESLRLAHPVDLLGAGSEAWHAFQSDAFRREVVQPFKQVFRELYVPTPAELDEASGSRRYAGHQVGPRPALALLTGRGWVSRPEEGVRRTFHDERLSAELWFAEGFFSPAEVDGLTLEVVRFARSVGDRASVPIADVPPRLFSEVMRDLDLVVSVAHAGGVDPEASASTVEMRASLVAETMRLLDLDNVRIDGPRAIIAGSLGEYSVHLGSAIVHLRPGGALFIVPVHAQNRGRLFLPFADDDPKTAEVLSKVLLLARDREIKDPGILDQIRHR